MDLDLTGVEGLSEAQIEAINAAHSQDVAGLKAKNSELLGKMDSFKGELATHEQTVEEARKAAVQAEAEKQEALGNYKEAQELREKERAELVAKAEQEAKNAQDALKQRDLKDVHFSILSGVADELKPAAQALLNGITGIEYSEKGDIDLTINYADKEFKNTNDFLEFAKTDATWKAMLKAPNTQGIGAGNSPLAQGAGGKTGQLTKAQRAQQINEKFNSL